MVVIVKTVQKHSEIVEGILPAHALSGCDTVASYFGIGKATLLKTLRSGHSLNLLGAPGHSMEYVIQLVTSFISACYGQTNYSTMSETMLKVWLPCHQQLRHSKKMLKESLEMQNPPALDSTEYGWVKDDQNKSLQPVTLPDEVELVPEMVLCIINCGCHSTTPCSSRACSCNSANMKFTIFCTCYNQGCCNLCVCDAHGQHNVQQCKLFGEVVAILKYELYNMLLVVSVRIQI